jgi:dipeptidyl-peptidase-4
MEINFDNVHLQNSMHDGSIDSNEDKQFDSQIYPDKNHGIYGGGCTKDSVVLKMTNFIKENL